MLQGSGSVFVVKPEHGSPPFKGAGFVQVRLEVTIWDPPPQVLVHEVCIKLAQLDHPPLTANLKKSDNPI